MFKTINRLGWLGVTLVGLNPLPLVAQTEVIQTSDQEATIYGDNNQVIQIVEQTTVNHPGRGSLRRANPQNNNRPGNQKKKKNPNFPGSAQRKGNNHLF